MVSIITINYNGYKDTCDLINSIRKYETYPYEIIVVDNSPTKEEALRLENDYPDATIISSEQNSGFAGGNNLGYEYSAGEYILFINNDVVINGPFLETLVNRMQSSPAIGAVSPKIKYEDHPNIIQYAGYTPMNPIRISNRKIGTKQIDHGQYDQAIPTAFIHGACVLTSRKVLEHAGLMTEIYFLFYEELDWSLQLQRAGYQTWFEPAVSVFHKESMTIKRGTPLRLYYLTRSRIMFTRRNYKAFVKVLALSYLLFIVIPKNILFYSIHNEKEMLIAFIKGSFHGLKDNIKEPHA
ncbi:glycosyltransferase family 2 protein [Parabacteroides sp.]